MASLVPAAVTKYPSQTGSLINSISLFPTVPEARSPRPRYQHGWEMGALFPSGSQLLVAGRTG